MVAKLAANNEVANWQITILLMFSLPIHVIVRAKSPRFSGRWMYAFYGM